MLPTVQPPTDPSDALSAAADLAEALRGALAPPAPAIPWSEAGQGLVRASLTPFSLSAPLTPVRASGMGRVARETRQGGGSGRLSSASLAESRVAGAVDASHLAEAPAGPADAAHEPGGARSSAWQRRGASLSGISEGAAAHEASDGGSPDAWNDLLRQRLAALADGVVDMACEALVVSWAGVWRLAMATAWMYNRLDGTGSTRCLVYLQRRFPL